MRVTWLLTAMLLCVLVTAGAGYADYEIAPSCGYCGEPLEGPHQPGCPQGGDSSEGSDYSDNSDNDAATQAEWDYERDRQQELERQRQQEAEQQRQQEAAERQRQREAERQRREESERQRQQEAERRRQQEAEQQRQREAERQRQQEADRRQQLEAEGRRTGMGPYIRTIHVPYPPSARINWQQTREVRADRPPLINLSPDAAVILGTIGNSIKQVPQQIGEFVLTCVAEGAGVNHSEEYLSILTVTRGYADNATAQIDHALQLINRGLPAAEVNAFLREQDNRALGVLAGEVDLPAGADLPLPLSAADEAERAAQGYNIAEKINGWLTGTPARDRQDSNHK